MQSSASKRDTITAVEVKINPARNAATAVRPRTCHPPVELHAMTTTRELAIPIPHEEIAAFCRKWGIKRLSFFGSVVRDDFDPERSDVDVLVDLRPDTKARGLAYFGAEIELSEIFGRKVDLLQPTELSRWMIKDVLSEAVEEYVEAV
jgi:predicted nucleotidyltransferase